MTLPSGTRLGRYEVRSQIGEGGMGVVYLARDPKIGRDVAIKVLPAAFSADNERLARFEQEACAAGALNHPNVLAVFDVGQQEGGSPYVVSEMLEGETLREKLNSARLPQRKALDYALQIARGLAAAHERGIVHRDLKPENVFITSDGRAKILDFGLAKLTQENGDQSQTDIPTWHVNTDPGAVMGTVGYMAPEQVRGQKVDHRADIFSFGCILYEMLSGRRAFRRESAVDTLSAILNEEPPDLSESNRSVSPALERLVTRCLEKRPAARFHSASDLAFALDALSGSNASSREVTTALTLSPQRTPRWRELLPWLVAAAAVLLAVLAFALPYLRRTSEEAVSTVRFPVLIPENTYPVGYVEAHNMSLSPDGRYLAYIAFSRGQRVLWVRPLSTMSAEILPGTEGAYSIFWSPDSRHLAFFADGKLKRIEASGKSLQTVCNLPVAGNATGSWAGDGTIIFSNEGDGSIYRIQATGGTPSVVLKGKGSSRRWVHFLPDGRHFIFYKNSEGENNAGLYAGSLDSTEIKQLAPMPPARAEYVKAGYLLYPREGSLVARAFDETNLKLTGEPVVVVERLLYFDKTGWADFSASQTGVLAYMAEYPKTQLLWLDRAGRETGRVGGPGEYAQLRLSPDGQRAALTTYDPRGGARDLWIQDLVRDTRTRFVSGPTDDGDPVWSPEGRRLAYFSCCEDVSALHIKESGDVGKGQLPVKEQSFITPSDWSQDGRFLIYLKSRDIWVLPLSGEARPYPLMETQSAETDPRLSPDGRWVAFVSDETGRVEVYVTRFDHPGEKWRISTEGGLAPTWRRDGRELFYMSADLNRLMAVEIKAGEVFGAGAPAQLFNTDVRWVDFDVAVDGQRFFFVASAPGTRLLPFTVVLNWTADLKR
jgi:serine/threonine protein kinase/Tol biopolymer transport system component